jgi:hypothetical protein
LAKLRHGPAARAAQPKGFAHLRGMAAFIGAKEPALRRGSCGMVYPHAGACGNRAGGRFFPPLFHNRGKNRNKNHREHKVRRETKIMLIIILIKNQNFYREVEKVE